MKLIANSEGYRAALRGNMYPVATARDSVGENGRLAVPQINDGAGLKSAPGWTTYLLSPDLTIIY